MIVNNMQITHQEIHYTTDDALYELHKKLKNWIQIKSYILLITEQFRDYQKDIIQESLADFAEQASWEHYDIEQIKDAFEQSLEWLNTKLKNFANKMDKVELFSLKWFVQVIVDNVLMTSMIGDVSVVIFRNNRLYYSLHNTTISGDKIDIFSDFIEWDVESHDYILYMGTKITDIFDDIDIKNIEDTMAQDEPNVILATDTLLQGRIDTVHVWFLVCHNIKWSSTRTTYQKKKFNLSSMKRQSPRFLKYKTNFLANKYYVSVWLLTIVILFLFYHVLAQMINVTETDVMFTEEWLLVDVTIDDIKKDIQVFLSMDPTSDVKWQKYYEIMQKLETLTARWRRLDDVIQLKGIIQKNYLQWFNIIYVNTMASFNDAWWSAQIFSFNNAERNALWDLLHINFNNNITVAGTQGVLIWALNNSVRWSIIDFWLSTDVLNCGKNLLRNGLYCFTTDTIYNVTSAGIDTLTTTDGFFPADIDWVDVYGQANMYVFHKWFTWWTWSTFISRYRNMMWSQTQYQAWQTNAVLAWANPVSFADWFSAYTIDWSFIAWSKTDTKLYQFWREWASALLSMRVVPLQWWDKATTKYSADVIPYAAINSKYVYLLDRENQTFTVYDSSPAKDADQFRRDFVLRYLFRFNFDLWSEKIIDFSIPEKAGNKPDLYILTTNAVYKIKLYEFIDSLTSGALKQVGN